VVIGATNPSAERRERAAIRAVLEKIRPPIDVDAMFAGGGGVGCNCYCSSVAFSFIVCFTWRVVVVVCGDGWRERRRA
jgi:hypothetical protein